MYLRCMLDKKTKALIGHGLKLTDEAVQLYKPVVLDMCRRIKDDENVSKDAVSRLLDVLLEFCFDSRAVELFRQVGKAAFYKYPELVTDYVRLYRELWDNE